MPTSLFHSLAFGWTATAAASPSAAISACVCDFGVEPRAEDDGGCDAVELVNTGVAMYDGELMNFPAAQRCWRRALMAPGRTRHGQFTVASQAAEAASVARENLYVLLHKHNDDFRRYANSASLLHVRGGTAAGGGRASACTSGGDAAARTHDPNGGSLRVHIEGWRGVSHSYAVVAAELIDELAPRCALSLSWSDAPMPPGFGAARRAAHFGSPPLPLPGRVRELPFGTVPEGATVLRISWPYNLSAPLLPRTRAIVFATAEHLECPENSLARGSADWSDLAPAVSVLTPSAWSVEGLVACGLRREQIGLAPHGVGSSLLGEAARQSASVVRRRERRARGWEGRFVFLHVGAGSPNKNLDTLIGAFAQMVDRTMSTNPHPGPHPGPHRGPHPSPRPDPNCGPHPGQPHDDDRHGQGRLWCVEAAQAAQARHGDRQASPPPLGAQGA